MALSVELHKKFKGFQMDVAFEHNGGSLGILGGSGMGKSMTLKMIAGLVKPDSGKVIVDGRTVYDSAAKIDMPARERHIGYLFQQYALFPNMTVMQNILCGVRSGTKAERRRKVQDSLRRFRLEGLEKKYPAQFSGGQQQRVAPDQLPTRRFCVPSRQRTRRCSRGGRFISPCKQANIIHREYGSRSVRNGSHSA